jgi:hypothetical protein
MNQWQIWQASLQFEFPESDLLAALVNAFMIHVNSMLPLIHRPTFETAVADRLHYRDPSFACVLLLVCANGSRYVDDIRVRLPDMSQRSAGWRYFKQVPIARWDFNAPPRLYDVQTHCLAGMFAGSSLHRLFWHLIGRGIRMCQEIGVHQRKLFGTEPHPQHEMWKRCFW